MSIERPMSLCCCASPFSKMEKRNKLPNLACRGTRKRPFAAKKSDGGKILDIEYRALSLGLVFIYSPYAHPDTYCVRTDFANSVD